MTIFDVGLDVLRQRQSMKWTRYPDDVLPLWVAEMDCRLSPGARAALERAVEIGDFGYHGRLALEPAWIRYAEQTWGLRLSDQQVAACGNVMAGMTALVEHLTPPGSVIATTTPIYAPFRPAATVAGRRLATVSMTPAGRLDLPGLAQLFQSQRPAAFLLCNPHNPCGSVATAAELTAVADLARQHRVLVVVDEIHSLLHDPAVPFVPYLSLPGGADGVVVTSASKAFGLAGVAAGLTVAGADRVEQMWSLPYEVRASASHLGLLAQRAALDQDRDWLAQLNRELVEHKELLADLLSELGLSYHPSPATYLAWVDCSSLGLADPAAHFLERGRVAFNAGSDYDQAHGQWIRINLATSPEIVREAIRRMAVALEKV
ncbi:MAG: aminotransferase class I/II-fold pyridoxal phosphate-dependent enzyme [Propionibacteriaceae bacterium]|nr:aminotransferase class I/II-fold pyridoxal phosphate-dependent enzyme [Propionibacteriaceae bacterium]